MKKKRKKFLSKKYWEIIIPDQGRNYRSYSTIVLKRIRNFRLHSEHPSNVFRPHYAGGIKNATISRDFGIVFEETRSGKSRDYIPLINRE